MCGSTKPATSASASRVLFHPAIVLSIALSAAVVFVLVMLPLPRFAGDRRGVLLTYHAPIAVVFVVYAFDRAERWRLVSLRQWTIEVAVVVMSLIRAVFTFPPVSGHALFLSYALVSTPRNLLWWVAAVALAEVVYVKLVLLRDLTLVSGAMVGVAAGILVRLIRHRD